MIEAPKEQDWFMSRPAKYNKSCLLRPHGRSEGRVSLPAVFYDGEALWTGWWTTDMATQHTTRAQAAQAVHNAE